MQNIKYPVDFSFKISTLANDFTATDAEGKTLAYVRQKMFKLKEEVLVYSDETKSQVNYKINADKWLDFSAAYRFSDSENNNIGKVVRKGCKSIWKAEYKIIDQFDKEQYMIQEDNAWVKVIDAVVGEIPVIGTFTGYMFNPSYTVSDLSGKPIAKLKKQASFFGRKFQITKEGDMDNDDDDRIMLAVMMMLLLERQRG